MLSDEWLPRYRLLENFNIKWNGNGNDHADYNSSFALRAVELKINLRVISKCHAHLQSLTKTPVKFQKDWDKIVGGVALTKYLLK